MYLLYNEHKKKTTSRRLVILARWLTHYFRDNRLCLDAEGGYFCFRTMSISRIKSNSISVTVSPPSVQISPFCEGANKPPAAYGGQQNTAIFSISCYAYSSKIYTLKNSFSHANQQGKRVFIFLARRLPPLRWGMNGGSPNLRK